MAFRIGTAEAGGTFFTQGEAIVQIFNRQVATDQKLTVETSEASIDNANRLERGDLEFGFMASNWIGRAKDGIPPFTKQIPLRMVAPANAGPIFFVTRADSDIESINDFRGHRIALGLAGSGMVQHAHNIFNVLKIPLSDFVPVYMSYAEAADALVAGEIAAIFQPPIPNRMMTELSERAEVRVVRYAPGQIERVLSTINFYRRATIEKGAFRGVTEDISQIAVVNVLVTHERVPELVVYRLTSVILENLHELPLINPLFRGIADLFAPLRTRGLVALEFGGVPFHPGAVRAYREGGWIQ